jgi:hypothetical protein
LNFSAARFIDRDKGMASTDPRRIAPEGGAVFGKVDIYHALQACLIPTLPTTGSVTRGLLETNLRANRIAVVHYLLRASGPNSILRTVPFDILIQQYQYFHIMFSNEPRCFGPTARR